MAIFSTSPVALAATAGGSFATPVLVLGALLVVGALVSGVARRSFLSLTAVFVLAGFVLGDGALGVLHFRAGSGFVADLAIVALVVILFRDGLEVEAEMLQTAWRPPLRKLLLGMPITAALVAVVTRYALSVSWTEAFLLGVLLSPTDPVLSSSLVTNPRVPRLVRHSLNLESGTNDGLALPAVLALIAALEHRSNFQVWRFVLQDVGLGIVTGLVIGFVAAKLMPRHSRGGGDIPAHQKSLFALGVAFTAYGVAIARPAANGLIAVYICAITLGIMRPDIREHFEQRADDIIEIVKLGIFVVFGSLLTLGGLFADGWTAVGIVAFTLFAARPIAVFVALAGTRIDNVTKGFMAWFGPKGVATMTFSLLVLAAPIASGARLFHIAALAVFASIILHGVTDTPGANWLARRAQRGEAVARGSARTALAAEQEPASP